MKYIPHLGDRVKYARYIATVICLGACCRSCNYLTIQFDGELTTMGNRHSYHDNKENCWHVWDTQLTFISSAKTPAGNIYTDAL